MAERARQADHAAARPEALGRTLGRVVQGASLMVVPTAMVGFIPFLQWRMRTALNTCTALIAKELRRRPPDVVVGSSWGGAVALRCLEDGLWAGPSLLLAPAVSAKGLWNLAWPSFEPSVPADAASKVLVVQVHSGGPNVVRTTDE